MTHSEAPDACLEKPVIEEGIYFDLPEAEYHAALGLSNSGMKDLSVSDLLYWHRNINPNAERDDATKPQAFGKALHCRLLEPARYQDSFFRGLSKKQFGDDLLVTVEDLKAYCAGKGLLVSGRKDDLIERVHGHNPEVPIWDVLVDRHAAVNEGKELLSDSDADRVESIAEVVEGDPMAKALLTAGMPEVSFFIRCPDTGVMLKARMDYVRGAVTVDLKSFSNSRGKSTDKAVFDAIYWEGYHHQTEAYAYIRELARQKLMAGAIQTHGLVSEEWRDAFIANERPGFAFLFVESDAPHDMRIIQMKRSESDRGDLNLYWSSALMRREYLISRYVQCLSKFGAKPWRAPQQIYALSDTDLPQLLFS